MKNQIHEHNCNRRLYYPTSQKDKSTRQKISKQIIELNHTYEQMDLVDVYRVFHPTTSEYTFFSGAHRSFSKIHNILSHKTFLINCKVIEIIPCIISDHSAQKLEINGKRWKL